MKERVGCGFWVTSKQRYCGGAALPGSKFCGNHQETTLRVPCPLDSSHNVDANKVSKHIAVCPAAKQLEAMKLCSYYSPALNAGSDDEEEETVVVIEALPGDKFEQLVSKIEAAHSALLESCVSEESFVKPSACNQWLSSPVDRRHPFQEKHLVQQASMLGNLEQFELLNQSDKAGIIEFGAGRGYLTHMLASCYAADKLVLVERRSYKFKADRTLRCSEGVSLSRLRVDIKDLNLDEVEELRSCDRVVAVSKHLCGSATDMTLRCCLRSKRVKLGGMGIATCCHHVCEWKAYVGKKVLASVGIGKAEFGAMAKMSSWAVSGDQCDATRAELGLMCKRVIDVGRVVWLQQQGLKARVVRYVPPDVSPENALIMARA